VENIMRLIVNADDLGASRKVNDAVFALMEAGLVSSASILVNGRAFDDAIARIPHVPRCSFGIHLNASDGLPLADSPELSPLLDEQRQFRKYAVNGVAHRPGLRRALYREWGLQMLRLRDAGVRIAHIDSHHHAHTNPWLIGVVGALQGDFAVRRVRIGNTLRRQSAISRVLKSSWAFALRSNGARTTDGFGSLLEYRQLCQEEKSPRGSTVELMVHPGLEKYRDETNLLSSDWWREQLRTNELINDNES
jgi:predicted glycoside hydrolase/deacetylase ChbG (UPF0249 family)